MPICWVCSPTGSWSMLHPSIAQTPIAIAISTTEAASHASDSRRRPLVTHAPAAQSQAGDVQAATFAMSSSVKRGKERCDTDPTANIARAKTRHAAKFALKIVIGLQSGQTR